MQQFNVFTDGSGDNKAQNGAYCFIILDEEDNILFQKSEATNPSKSGREEVKALYYVIECLNNMIEILDHTIKFTIYSDAQYVVNAVKKGWMDNWAIAKFNDRVNGDLWEEIQTKYRKLEQVVHLDIQWCKGHRKVEQQKTDLDKWACKWNNYVDELAGSTRKESLK